jgi:hypothetical protein
MCHLTLILLCLKTKGMLHRSCIFLLIGFLFSGCVGWKSKSEVPEKSEHFRAQVVSGQTSRNEVHERLGKPFISDEKIEAYRVLEDPDVLVILPAWETQEVILYALIVYRKDGLVGAIDWSVYRERTGTSLQAGGFYFSADRQSLFGGRKEILLAPTAEAEETLRSIPSSKMCAVVVFFYDAELEVKYYLDGNLLVETPLVRANNYWAPRSRDVFIKILVPEGKHELKVKTALKPGDFRRHFICKPRSILYAYPMIELVETGLRDTQKTTYRYEGELVISDVLQDILHGRRRLLFYKGTWLGED